MDKGRHLITEHDKLVQEYDCLKKEIDELDHVEGIRRPDRNGALFRDLCNIESSVTNLRILLGRRLAALRGVK